MWQAGKDITENQDDKKHSSSKCTYLFSIKLVVF